ncbi:yueH-like family protein [Anoxybacillus sp. B7M1]|uniref:YueH family protein n=1 Tax=unclassified Anoxybacillus TaxID=2639704 RepID=UPI0005CD7824|nr:MULTISPECIES: YueH family protein [unclassified Anoxybacillus]ANB57506.1 yueH-like family protein [Anoxybacillus sp. B2M1]ANB63363.1 yueH-like family protein [Anoxybacillus sp. B7M1]
MKIRKANILNERETANVYIYENKKEEHIVVAIPHMEWSFLIRYEEETELLRSKLLSSLSKKVEGAQAELLVDKLLYWVREM